MADFGGKICKHDFFGDVWLLVTSANKIVYHVMLFDTLWIATTIYEHAAYCVPTCDFLENALFSHISISNGFKFIFGSMAFQGIL